MSCIGQSETPQKTHALSKVVLPGDIYDIHQPVQTAKHLRQKRKGAITTYKETFC